MTAPDNLLRQLIKTLYDDECDNRYDGNQYRQALPSCLPGTA